MPKERPTWMAAPTIKSILSSAYSGAHSAGEGSPPTLKEVLDSAYPEGQPAWAQAPTRSQIINTAFAPAPAGERGGRKRSRRRVIGEHERKESTDPQHRSLLAIVNEIGVQDILNAGVHGLDIPPSTTPERYVDQALTETRARMSIAIAEVEDESLSPTQEILVTPFNSGALELRIRDEILSRTPPENTFAVESDVQDSQGVAARVQYRDFLEIPSIVSADGARHRWYMRTTIPVGAPTAYFPERIIEGETGIVTVNHPEQLVLRREFTS